MTSDGLMRRELVRLGTVLALCATLVPAAQAQSSVPTAQACIAEMSQLDKNADGFVENKDLAEYGPVETNVDIDNDGRLSVEERRIACESGLLKPLKTKGVVG